MTKAKAIDRYRALRLAHAEPTDAPTWFVLYVNAGREKAVAEDLAEFGFSAFCPMEVEWRLKPRQQRRKGVPDRVKHERPLLSRYVFVGMPVGGPWRTVKLIDGVVDALKSDGRYWPVPSPAIDRMRDAYEAGMYDRTCIEAERLIALIGQVVDLKSGPFAGLSAKVTAASAKYVSAEIDMMGRATTLKLALEDVGRG
jgi:transcription antitermination factor NusG